MPRCYHDVLPRRHSCTRDGAHNDDVEAAAAPVSVSPADEADGQTAALASRAAVQKPVNWSHAKCLGATRHTPFIQKQKIISQIGFLSKQVFKKTDLNFVAFFEG